MSLEWYWSALLYVYLVGFDNNEDFPRLVLAFAIAASAIMIGYRIVRHRILPAIRQRRRGKMPQCRACGYPVEGLPGDVCPECGGSLAGEGTWRPEPPRPPRSVPGRARRVIGWTLFAVIYYPFVVVLLLPVAPRPIVVESREYVGIPAPATSTTGRMIGRCHVDSEWRSYVPFLTWPGPIYLEVWTEERMRLPRSPQARRMQVGARGQSYGFVDVNGQWREGNHLNETVLLNFLHAAGADPHDQYVHAAAKQLLPVLEHSTGPQIGWHIRPLGKKDRYNSWIHREWLAVWALGVAWIVWRGRKRSRVIVEPERAPAVTASA